MLKHLIYSFLSLTVFGSLLLFSLSQMNDMRIDGTGSTVGLEMISLRT